MKCEKCGADYGRRTTVRHGEEYDPDRDVVIFRCGSCKHKTRWTLRAYQEDQRRIIAEEKP